MRHSCKRDGRHTHHLDDDELDLGYSSDSSFENYYLYSEEERILVGSLNDSDFKYSGDETRDRVQLSAVLRSAKEKRGCHGVALDSLCDMIMTVERNRRTMRIARNHTRSSHANNGRNTLPRKPTTARRGGARRRSPKRGKLSTPDAIVHVHHDPQSENPRPVNPQPNSQPENPRPVNPHPENSRPADGPISPPQMHYFTRRELCRSDMRDSQCRLTMPEGQILDESFFTEEESERLKKDRLDLEVKVIDPRHETWDSKLRYRKAGSSSYCYVIGTPWNDLRRVNGFKENMIIQVCALRRRDDGKLCFILRN